MDLRSFPRPTRIPRTIVRIESEAEFNAIVMQTASFFNHPLHYMGLTDYRDKPIEVVARNSKLWEIVYLQAENAVQDRNYIENPLPESSYRKSSDELLKRAENAEAISRQLHDYLTNELRLVPVVQTATVD